MVFWVIMGVAIGNLLLGFGLAVFLHRRYQAWVLSESAGSTDSGRVIGFSGGNKRELSAQSPVQKEVEKKGSSVSGKEVVLASPAIGARVIDPYDSGPILEDSSLEGAMASLPEGQQLSEPMPEAPSQTGEEPEPVGLTEADSGAEASAQPEQKAASSADSEPPLGSVPAKNPSELQGPEPPGEDLLLAEDRKTEPAETSVPQTELLPGRGSIPESSAEGAGPESILSLRGEKPAEGLPEIPEPERKDGKVPENGELRDTQVPEAEQAIAHLPGGPDSFSPSSALSASSQEESTSFEEPTKQQKFSGPDGFPLEGGMVFQRGEQPPEPPSSGGPLQAEKGSVSETGEVLDTAEWFPSLEFPSLRQGGLEASLERALAQWQAEAARYFEELSRTRIKVQNFSASPSPEELHASLGAIHRAGQEYLSTARPVREAFGQLPAGFLAGGAIRDHLNTLAAKEETLIELTQELIPPDLQEADTYLLRRQLLQHTDRLLEANRKVQSALETARRGQPEQTLDSDSSSLSQASNGLLQDESIREKVTTWWSEQRRSTRRLSVILLEVDDFGQIQEEFGPSISEGLLRAVQRLVELEDKVEGFLVPLAGPRFARFCANVAMDQAAAAAEHFRQTLMATLFYRKKTQLRISVSCGLTEATRDDTLETMLERAEVALLQARRYGKGRCFFHDGFFPMPVPAHALPISPKQMEI